MTRARSRSRLLLGLTQFHQPLVPWSGGPLRGSWALNTQSPRHNHHSIPTTGSSGWLQRNPHWFSANTLANAGSQYQLRLSKISGKVNFWSSLFKKNSSVKICHTFFLVISLLYKSGPIRLGLKESIQWQSTIPYRSLLWPNVACRFIKINMKNHSFEQQLH